MNGIMVAGLALAVASGTVFQSQAATNGLSRAERQALRLQKVGGYLPTPKSYKGLVALVNRQTRVDETNLVAIAELFERETRCKFRVVREAEGATVRLTVIDDPKEPVMLLAPDDRWGVVNLAKVVDDLPGESARAKFFVPRARKLVVKALSILCGGAASTFPGNVMNAASARELDELKEQVPFDMTQKYASYLPRVGVTPKVEVTYRTACREGWAPAPTNEAQKAIWEKVHAIPATPMKIEFDSKKGR